MKYRLINSSGFMYATADSPKKLGPLMRQMTKNGFPCSVVGYEETPPELAEWIAKHRKEMEDLNL